MASAERLKKVPLRQPVISVMVLHSGIGGGRKAGFGGLGSIGSRGGAFDYDEKFMK